MRHAHACVALPTPASPPLYPPPAAATQQGPPDPGSPDEESPVRGQEIWGRGAGSRPDPGVGTGAETCASQRARSCSPLTSAPPQRFQDTSQYVLAELRALEVEQQQLDARAAVVETDLRFLMQSGMDGPPCPLTRHEQGGCQGLIHSPGLCPRSGGYLGWQRSGGHGGWTGGWGISGQAVARERLWGAWEYLEWQGLGVVLRAVGAGQRGSGWGIWPGVRFWGHLGGG